MKVWLLCAAVAVALFVVGSRAMAQPMTPPALPVAITISSSNGAGATLTQVIHRRPTIEQVLADLTQLRASTPALSCPVNHAGQYAAVLAYSGGVQTRLTAEKGGCERVVVEGSQHRAGLDPTLLRDFDALFPPDWQTGF
jgi:hypothetical protein